MTVKNTIIKVHAFLLIVVVVTLLSLAAASAADHPILYLFWGDGCPHCEKEKTFLLKLHEKYPELEMRWFEVWRHEELTLFTDRMRKAHEIKTSSVPMTFLGTWNSVGFRSDDTSGRQIEAQVVACIKNGCADAVSKLGPLQIVWMIRDQASKNAPVGWDHFPATIAPRKDMDFQVDVPEQQTSSSSASSLSPAERQSDSQSTPRSDQMLQPDAQALPETVQQPSEVSPSPDPQSVPDEEQKETVSIPLLGSVTLDISRIGLPLFTFIIGGLDGFNPCAMWVLCFLLTLVIYAKSRTKILMIGGIFVLASGVIYFLFMIAWLNIFVFAKHIKFLTKIVGVVAVVMGAINFKDFFFFKQGVSLTIPESAQPKLFKRMRSVVNASALPAMILGTIVLAVTANLIELLCTAGFPAIYTRILTLQNLSKWQEYAYLVLYNVIYVIPLAVIVGVFAWKMGGRKLGEKEGRVLKLISGVMMLVLGIILLIKPQILMFG
ncbi:hypothetical protein CSA56_10325 [candidate division KSB3 bacterium]|uniref:Thioredoxin domain-containing protein n=1 Tax=candidate division KSB3 bacterium TaxID=2044937 RepID=A0A2G6KDL4_9BACT|nr:MAG: hypothetical protein CSA56_10325 [candidate division KSB3 bacterium]